MELANLQAEMASHVERRDRFGEAFRVAGVDVAYSRDGDRLCAAAVVCSLARLSPDESIWVRGRADFPYRPGLLGCREGPALLAVLARLKTPPDIVLVDGHGIAHPRRFGVACLVGVAGRVPTVGVGKSRLVGDHGPVAAPRGSSSPLIEGGAIVGVALRTQTDVRPVYVSTGHRVGLESAVGLVLACSTRFRLPEPIRQAHALSRRGLAQEEAE